MGVTSLYTAIPLAALLCLTLALALSPRTTLCLAVALDLATFATAAALDLHPAVVLAVPRLLAQ